MGSFSYTCAISGLPIEAGDPVRYLLLTENPYEKTRACNMHDLWFVRTFPLRAIYNDYGSVEKVQDGPERQVWLDMLRKDIVERGWGDNSCHDVPVRKDMTFEELLGAIVEGRVFVKRESHHEFPAEPKPRLRFAVEVTSATGTEPIADPKNAAAAHIIEASSLKKARRQAAREHPVDHKAGRLMLRRLKTEPSDKDGRTPSGRRVAPVGVPTLQRVEKALLEAGQAIFGYSVTPTRRKAASGFMIDRTCYGEIRVRWRDAGYDSSKEIAHLSKAQALLSNTYATMISAGDGRYAHSADMTVRPKPGTANFRGRKGRGMSTKPLQITHAMIREDVWQALLSLRADNWSLLANKKHLTIQNHHDYADKFLKAAKTIVHQHKREKPIGALDAAFWLRTGLEHLQMKNPVAGWFGKEILPYSIGPTAHWIALLQQDAITPEFQKTVAEFALIQRLLTTVRFWWRPSYSCGPQFGAWQYHEDFQKALLAVTQNSLAKERAERAKDDDDEDDSPSSTAVAES